MEIGRAGLYVMTNGVRFELLFALVALLKMQPHYSQSSRENATPSNGTLPLTTPENTITYHNALCLSVQNFA